MAIRQRIKRRVKKILKSVIDRWVDEDTKPFQESKPAEPEEPIKKSTAEVPSKPEDSKVQASKPVSEESVSDKKESGILKEVSVSASLGEPVEKKETEKKETEKKETEKKEAEKKEAEDTISIDKPQAEPVAEKQELSEEEKKAAAAAKHWEKTRRGLLKKLKKSGGSLSLAELHDFSERRYFIGHQKFSMIMAELVEEQLLDYSLEDYMVSLGEKAEDYLSRS